MQTFTIEVPLRRSTAAKLQELDPDKRDLLDGEVAELIERYVTRATTSTRYSAPTPKILVAMANIKPEVGTRLITLARNKDMRLSHVVRVALCDYMRLRPSHPDRLARDNEYRLEEWRTSTTELRVTMSAVNDIKEKLYGRQNRATFRDVFLPNWLDRKELTVRSNKDG